LKDNFNIYGIIGNSKVDNLLRGGVEKTGEYILEARRKIGG